MFAACAVRRGRVCCLTSPTLRQLALLRFSARQLVASCCNHSLFKSSDLNFLWFNDIAPNHFLLTLLILMPTATVWVQGELVAQKPQKKKDYFNPFMWFLGCQKKIVHLGFIGLHYNKCTKAPNRIATTSMLKPHPHSPFLHRSFSNTFCFPSTMWRRQICCSKLSSVLLESQRLTGKEKDLCFRIESFHTNSQPLALVGDVEPSQVGQCHSSPPSALVPHH